MRIERLNIMNIDDLKKQLDDLNGINCLDYQAKNHPPCEVCLHCKNKEINEIKHFLTSLNTIFHTIVIPKGSTHVYMDKETFLNKKQELLFYLQNKK